MYLYVYCLELSYAVWMAYVAIYLCMFVSSNMSVAVSSACRFWVGVVRCGEAPELQAVHVEEEQRAVHIEEMVGGKGGPTAAL